MKLPAQCDDTVLSEMDSALGDIEVCMLGLSGQVKEKQLSHTILLTLTQGTWVALGTET